MPACIDVLPACPASSFKSPVVPSAQRPKVSLNDLPVELHWAIVDQLKHEDSVARLGSTDRYWRQLTQPRLTGQPGAALSVAEAVKSGRKYALGRTLNWPQLRGPARVQRLDARIRDDDGMTLLMHAAAGQHRPMVRLLMKPYFAPDLFAVDKAGLTARHWAALGGGRDAFDADVAFALLKDTESQGLQIFAPMELCLHHAIAYKQHTLAHRLMTPYFEQDDDHVVGPGILQMGFTHLDPLPCGHKPLSCALLHGDDKLTLFESWWRALGLAVPDPTQAAYFGQILQTQGHLPGRTTRQSILTTLIKLGLGIHAPSKDGQTYYQRWLARSMSHKEDVDIMSQVDGDILRNTPSGLMLLHACLRRADPQFGQTITQLLQAGVMGDAAPAAKQSLAASLAADFYLDDALCDSLIATGIDLTATDAEGDTLAHHATRPLASVYGNRACAQHNVLSLARRGVNITQRDAAGYNPVYCLLFRHIPLRLERMKALHAAGIVLDRPGRVVNAQGGIFDAHTVFEAALFVEDIDVLEYMFERSLCCSSAQLEAATKRLNQTSAAWPQVWLRAKRFARALGMHGHYTTTFNPAGGWHDGLSRKRLRETHSLAQAQVQHASEPGKTRFWRIVRSNAIGGAIAARAIGMPLTRSLDALLGTQKTSTPEVSLGPALKILDNWYSQSTDRRALGAVASTTAAIVVGLSAGTYGVLIGATLPLAAHPGFRRRNLTLRPKSGEVLYATIILLGATDYVICRPVSQIAAIVGCLPKALISAGGMAVGGSVGLIKATDDWRTQHDAARLRRAEAKRASSDASARSSMHAAKARSPHETQSASKH